MDWTHRLRLRHAQILLSLAKTHNISRSADALSMTQPALSKWLKELEIDVGLPLFERHARGLRPTPHGRTLLEFAARIDNELDRARDEMAALKGGSTGRALIGASGAAIASVVPQAVLRLLSSMPDANVEVVEAPMDRLFQQLVQREIDVAVGRASPKYHDAEIVSEALYDERLDFAVRQGHPLARRRKIEWQDLMDHKWVVWTRDIPARDLLESALSSQGRGIPAGSVQSNSLLATIALIADSNMVAVVSEHAIALPERNKSLCRLSAFRLETKSPVTVYWRKDASGSAAIGVLLDALRDVSSRQTRAKAKASRA